MAVNENKDTSHVVATTKMYANDNENFYEIYLWDDLETMQAEVADHDEDTHAIVNHSPCVLTYNENGMEVVECDDDKLGEVHFVCGLWDMEKVAHELLHAMWGRIKMLKVDIDRIVDQGGESEEWICSEFGKWVDEVYRWLWSNDPNMMWKYMQGEKNSE